MLGNLFNPMNANPIKWSNTFNNSSATANELFECLFKFKSLLTVCSKLTVCLQICFTNFLSVFDYCVGLALKGLN